MTVAKLGTNGPMNVASDNALPRMRNHLQCHKSRRWRQHQQGSRQRQGRSRHNTPLSRTMFRRSPAAEPKPVSTCQAVATRTRPSSPARSTAISLSLRRLSWSGRHAGPPAALQRWYYVTYRKRLPSLRSRNRLRIVFGFARQALIATCHEGTWWQLDDWHLRLGSRVPSNCPQSSGGSRCQNRSMSSRNG